MKLIVFETRGIWAAALRRVLSQDALLVRETRSLAECESELAAAPTSFVVAELDNGNGPQLMERLSNWRRQMPKCAIAVVAGRDLIDWRPAMLEAGAMLTIFSPRRLNDLVKALRRCLARHPQPPGSIADRIWSELPLG
jgi:DNA-binding NarL/FixJ family response regulator